LLDIISGLLVPDTGVVSVDGRPLDDGNRLAWCNSVAYVVQDAQLGNGTIRQNITRFAPDTLPDEAIWEALRLAGADAIVSHCQMDWSSRLATGGNGFRVVSASGLHWRVHWSHSQNC
jgi:ABC-type multidrug transport system fused ATPase/permease subunit